MPLIFASITSTRVSGNRNSALCQAANTDDSYEARVGSGQEPHLFGTRTGPSSRSKDLQKDWLVTNLHDKDKKCLREDPSSRKIVL